MRCVLIGNYGVGNLGDEALRQYFIGAYPDISWQVLSARPVNDQLPRLPGGIRSLFGPWWKTWKAIREADAVVFGGGTLFTDVESSYACFLWWIHGITAYLLGTPIILAFQGVGPFATKRGTTFARSICSKAALITVRDTSSYHRVKSWGLGTEVVQTFDPVFSLLEKKNHIKNSQNVFVIIPRANSQKMLLERALRKMQETKFDAVSIVLLQPDDEGEQAAANDLGQHLAVPSRVVAVRSIEDLGEAVGSGGFVLTERFHGAVAALARGVPFETVSQGVGDKLSALPHDASQESMRSLILEGESALRRALERVAAHR